MMIRIILIVLSTLFFSKAYSQDIEIEKYKVVNDSGEIVNCVIFTEQGFNTLIQIIESKIIESNEPENIGFLNWKNMLSDLKYFSDSKFNSEYGERKIVNICIESGLNLPSFMRTTVGKKSDKIEYLRKESLIQVELNQ